MHQSLQYEPVAEVETQLAFSRPADVIVDTDGRGLKRAPTRPLDDDFAHQFEYRRCRVRDWSAPGQPRPSFRAMGFETINLAPIAPPHTERARAPAALRTAD